MSNFRDKEKRGYDHKGLAKNQYWDTVRLKDGGIICVIKLKSKVYPKGY